MTTGLRVLITNIAMNGRTGTEIFTRNLAAGLLRRGHTPIVYSPELGEIAAELKSLGVPVLASIDRIREAPDVIHGHHVIQAGIAAMRFPATPALFVCHDFVAWHDSPPRLPGFVRYVAVGDATADRLTMEEGVPPEAMRIIENGVDIDRFRPGQAPPPVPRKALLVAKSREQVGPVARACEMRGIALDVAGAAVGRTLETPEEVFPGYDLVFASGMTAIEALACHRPVIVCDGRGLAGFVDTNRYPGWRRQNFGLRTLVQPLTPERLASEIDRYHPGEALAVGQRIRGESALDGWIARYEALYGECIAEFAARRESAHATPEQLALHVQSWSTAGNASWERERRLLGERVAALHEGLLPLVPGERVAATDFRRIALRGFHPAEYWGAWSASPLCGARFHCAATQGRITARIEYWAFLPPGRPRFEITCLVNGLVAATWVDDPASRGTRESFIESRTVELDLDPVERETVFLTFRTSALRSPASDDLSADARPVGFGLVAITLAGEGSTAARASGSVAGDANDAPAEAPAMSVVVMSHRAPPTLVEAVRSVVAQRPPAETVVVNSGGGGAAALLARAGLDVRVIEADRPLLPGGARNLGIAVTKGRYVAFLADDCTAGPGWTAARLAAHAAGAASVASALVCHLPRNPIALAAHLSLFVRRMPLVPPGLALAYGASYERKLFEVHGGFREDLRGGEDTEFHQRLPAAHRPAWTPAVLTTHFGPATAREFAADQFRRGRRAAEAWHSINGLDKRVFAKGIVLRIGMVIRLSMQVVPPGERVAALLALPLTVAGALVYACGALGAAGSPAPARPAPADAARGREPA